MAFIQCNFRSNVLNLWVSMDVILPQPAPGTRRGERKLPELRVRSNVMRLDAHRFYEREGFRLKKTQKVLALPLGGGA